MVKWGKKRPKHLVYRSDDEGTRRVRDFYYLLMSKLTDAGPYPVFITELLVPGIPATRSSAIPVFTPIAIFCCSANVYGGQNDYGFVCQNARNPDDRSGSRHFCSTVLLWFPHERRHSQSYEFGTIGIQSPLRCSVALSAARQTSRVL
jgi:hypothetical protein